MSRTIDEMRRTSDYDAAELMVAMVHLYHHMNTAWNSRDATADQVANASQENFRAWSQYPVDLVMME